jgi:hypothetical protein
MGTLKRWTENIEEATDDRLMEAAASLLKTDKPIVRANCRSSTSVRLVDEMYDPIIERLEERARDIRAAREGVSVVRKVGKA